MIALASFFCASLRSLFVRGCPDDKRLRFSLKSFARSLVLAVLLNLTCCEASRSRLCFAVSDPATVAVAAAPRAAPTLLSNLRAVQRLSLLPCASEAEALLILL